MRDVPVPELLEKLTEVQRAICVSDPRAVATEATTASPRLLALFREERLILAELKRRKTLLSRAIGWTVLSADVGGGQADASASIGTQGSR